ncbi:PD-(D/E)XK nuclease family protein [Streptomyces sp. NPDC058045]|uniref:PD-(D/E)XK nuclease family protein n=1 Tax=Streptomyces sp. NPDC058045 TaxID=3346311 RepID=UPI0036E5B2CB
MFAQPTTAGKPTAHPTPGDVIAQQIRRLIIDSANNAPRSQQRRIGPSEVGNPCDRALAYKSMDWPTAPGADREPWASVQGTAIYTWMAELFEQRDPKGERYLVERRVTVHQGHTEDATIAGSADLYDRLTGTVYDWKATSPDSLAKYRRNGPGDQYRIQANLYGLGMENAGETPRRVAIVFLPRQYRLEPYVWVDEYRRDVALAAIARLQAIRERLLALDPEANPAQWAAFPTSPDAKCFFCDWHQRGSTDLSRGCPGHT